MRCASKAAESASARLCADAEAETTATDVPSVAESTQPVSPGDAGAGHEDTRVSQSTSSVSRTLLIRMTDPYRRQLNPSRLPSVSMDDACVAASLVHLMSQMNHRRSEGARGRETRAPIVVSFLQWTPLLSEVPVLLSARRRKSGTAMCCVSPPEKKAWMPPKSVSGSLVGDDE
uniref:Uncharacterized protein n=1 Tax=Peronospora matthiolae TaxID=2874970 RepID=A0AAV1T7R8_9STRA